MSISGEQDQGLKASAVNKTKQTIFIWILYLLVHRPFQIIYNYNLLCYYIIEDSKFTFPLLKLLLSAPTPRIPHFSTWIDSSQQEV